MIKERQILLQKRSLFLFEKDLVRVVEPIGGRIPLQADTILIELLFVNFAAHVPAATYEMHKEAQVEDQFDEIEGGFYVFRYV